MRMLAVSLVAVALLGLAPPLAAAKLSGEEQLAKMVEGRTAGKPVDCLPGTSRFMSSSKIDKIGMVYGSGRRIYVNRFDGGCPTMTSFDTVVTVSPIGRLCRGDIARIVDLTVHLEHGSCVLGAFTPYDKVK